MAPFYPPSAEAVSGWDGLRPIASGYRAGMTAGDQRAGPDGASARAKVRIAAAGDVHCSEANRAETAAAFDELEGHVDLVLLAGDLTTHGEPEQAAVLAEACADASMPVVAVLGNHDWHSDRVGEVTEALRQGGVTVLDRDHTVREVNGVEVGIVGAKGFVGGFPGSNLPDFGEPSLRRVYAETTAEVEALEAGLRAVEVCPLRVVLLHYAPITATLEGEPREILAFLGSDRLAAPISQHTPDVVLHGHAHAGTLRGELAGVPVFNVSVPVLGESFWRFELTAEPHAREPMS